MSKNKKRKIVSLKPVQLSPENYIKANGRLLPIAECAINRDWESTGLCNILIARKHKNGNLTAGIYLVDMYCLGVKDAGYRFNLSEDEYEDMKGVFPDWELCDYVLAHNIIYGAIAYAKEYGFMPHKDFAIAQFMLEEDDEQVELMELEFGLDGKPFYVHGPHDDAIQTNRIISTLKRTAGEGNFTVVSEDEIDDEEFEVDEFDDDVDAEKLTDFFVKENEANFKSFVKVFIKVNKAYDDLVRTQENRALLEQSQIGNGYTINDAESDDDRFDSIEQDNEYMRLSDMVINSEDYGSIIQDIFKAIEKYPGVPMFYSPLQLAYTLNDQFDAAEKVAREVYRLYPDYLLAKIGHANLLIDEGQSEDAPAVFNYKTDLGQIYPDRKVFNTGDAAAYYACMCRYFIAADDIDSADLYMNAIIKNDFIKIYGQLVLKTVIEEMCKAKMDKMESLVSK